MSGTTPASQKSILRLSRYHCFLGELRSSTRVRRIRSREIAEELGLSEETVRRDLSHIDMEGRPGAGYDTDALFKALQEYLDLTTAHPFIAVGNLEMLQGLSAMFPAEDFGLRAVACYSERPGDVGSKAGDLEVQDLRDLRSAKGSPAATIAVLACEPAHVDEALETLDRAGITGVLMLTPVLRPKHPEGMNVTYFRIPCALKSLAANEPATPSCCAAE